MQSKIQNVRAIIICLIMGVIFFCSMPNAHAAPIVIGHRGVSVSGYVENTLGAFTYAGQQGSKMVELDVYWTSDDIPVVSHDATMDRMTNCTGLISEQTWAKLRTCKINGTSETLVPLARAVTTARHGKFELLVHMGPRTITDKQAKSIVDLAYRGWWSTHVLVQSFFHGTLRVVKAQEYTHKVRYVVLTSSSSPTPSYIRKYNSNTVALRMSNTNKAEVAAYHAAGIKVFLWTTVSKADQLEALSMRPDGIITDNTPSLERMI